MMGKLNSNVKGSSAIENYYAEVNTETDYYPFGMIMPGRSYNGTSSYRFGFNKGSEKDDEVYGEGNSYTTFFRELDTRLGIWWGCDPKPDGALGSYVSMDDNSLNQYDPKGDCPDCPAWWNTSEDIFKGFADGLKVIAESVIKVEHDKQWDFEKDGLIKVDVKAVKQIPSNIASLPKNVKNVYSNGTIRQKAQLTTVLAGTALTLKSATTPAKYTNVVKAGQSIKLLNQFNSVESLIKAATNITRVKGGAMQGMIKGDGMSIFKALVQNAKQLPNGRYLLKDGTNLGYHLSKSTNEFTIDINKAGAVFKIRVAK